MPRRARFDPEAEVEMIANINFYFDLAEPPRPTLPGSSLKPRSLQRRRCYRSSVLYRTILPFTIMQPTDHILIHPLPGYGVVVCLHHQYCLSPNKIIAHFENNLHPHHLSVSERQTLQAYVDEHIALVHEDITKVRRPTEIIEPIRGLAIHTSAASCLSCGLIKTGDGVVENMKRHLRDAHQARAPTNGMNNVQKASWWSSQWRTVSTQVFFDRGGTTIDGAKHFEVSPTGPTVDAAEPALDELLNIDPSLLTGRSIVPATTLDRLQAQLEAAGQGVAEEERVRLSHVPACEDRQTNPYLEHTGFQQCVQEMDWQTIRRYVSSPSSSAELKFLRESVKSMALVYQHVTLVTPRWARIQVMQENPLHVPLSPLIPYLSFNNSHSSTIVNIFTFFHHVLSGDMPAPPTLTVNQLQRSTWRQIHDFLHEMDGDCPSVDTCHRRFTFTAFETLLHNFWMALVEQTAGRTDFELAIVTPLAFIAVDPCKDQFRAGYNFATDCSAIKKYMRMAACFKFYPPASEKETLAALERADETMRAEADTNDEEAKAVVADAKAVYEEHLQREATIASSHEQFKQWVRRYLSNDQPTSMQWIITTAHYIAKQRYGESVDAFVRWQGSRVTVRDLTTSFQDYTAMVWALQARAEQLLDELTFTEDLAAALPIPWDAISCEPSNNTAGYTPFAVPHSKALAAGKDFVARRLTPAASSSSKRSSALAITSLDNLEQVQRYCNAAQRFLHLLFLLCHLTSGQPGRLTEVLSIQLQNSISNGKRNVYLHNGRIALVPRYHKGYNRDKSLKFIYRYLPREVGTLLVHYAWVVRPFYALVTFQKQDGPLRSHYMQARSDFLWSDGDGKQFSDSKAMAATMRKETERYLGAAVGPSLMRHLIITLERHPDDDDDDDGLPKSVQSLTPEEVEQLAADEDANTAEMQAGHQPNTGAGIYGAAIPAQLRAATSEAHAFLRVSTKWHRRLGFKEVPAVSKKTRLSVASVDHLSDPKFLRAALKGNFPTISAFRGCQLEVLQAIMEGQAAVSYVAPTGSGKSLAFLLPALCDDYGQAVIITPLVALRKDIARKCTKLLIPVTSFGAADFDETAAIILVMPEQLEHREFLRLVARLNDAQALRRIVIDECHYLFSSDSEYRPALLMMRGLGKFQVPLTLLSATVPSAAEKRTYASLGITEHVLSFREPTSRANIQYETKRLDSDGPVDAAKLAAFLKHRSQLSARRKLLVFVATVELVEELSTLLGWPGYHGRLEASERDQIEQNFLSDKALQLLTTSAFVAGVDSHNIDEVDMVGLPNDALIAAQATGRGGRDGRPCVAVFIVGRGLPTFLEKMPSEEQAMIKNFVRRGESGTSCMRVPLDEYFDGNHQRLFCTDDEAQCAACLRRSKLASHPPITPARRPRAVADSPSGTSPAPLSLSSLPSSPPLPPACARQPLFSTSRPQMLPSSGSHFAAPQTLPSPRTTTTSSTTTPKLPLTSFDALGIYSSPAPASSRPRVDVDLTTPTTRGASSRPQAGKRTVSSASLPSSPPAADELHSSAKKARINRALAHTARNVQAQAKHRARLVGEEFPATGAFWQDNCVKCLTDGESFQHARSGCNKQLGDLVKAYRNRIGHQGQFPPGNCYRCVFPIDSCDRFRDPDTGTVTSKPNSGPCTYPFAILDTWACLWENSEAIRAHWIQRIDDESGGQTDGTTAAGFSTYFRGGVHVGAGKPFSRILVDINWITHQFYLVE